MAFWGPRVAVLGSMLVPQRGPRRPPKTTPNESKIDTNSMSNFETKKDALWNPLEALLGRSWALSVPAQGVKTLKIHWIL